jgi:RND superfamily putative drug exporter
MGTMLYRLGTVAARRPWRILLIWVAIAATVIVARNTWGGESIDSFDLPGAESQNAVELIEERFPGLTGTTSRIVFHSDTAHLDEPPQSQAISDAIDRGRVLEHVTDITDPLAQTTDALSSDGRTAYATISYSVRFDALTSEDLAAIEAATTPAREAGLQVEIGGAVADFGDTDSEGSEGIGLLIAVIVLILALGSVTAMLLPIGLALFSMAIGMGLLGLFAAIGDVPQDTTTLATMIGLGVGIDYALFVLTRYRQLVATGRDRPTAIARANATAGHAVVFAGITVLVAIIGLRASGLPAIAMMGYGTAIFVALSVLAAVTLLPALLAITGTRIDGLLARTRRKRIAAAGKPDATSIAGRWANHVGNHPARYALVSLIVLICLAIPTITLRIGFSDAGAESTDRTARRAHDLLADAFGPGFNGPLLAVADLRSTPDPVAAAEHLGDELALLPEIDHVGQPLMSQSGDAAIITAIPHTSPQDEQTTKLVEQLREEILPRIEHDTGATILLGGSVAGFVDVSERLSSRLPWFIGAVVLLSVLLLMALFRSVLVPIKAALMNLLSIAAAYGIVVAIFQWGWGNTLLGLDETVPINPFVPTIMFAILFGLSMDYEVFLLSRIREEYHRTGDNQHSVVTGLTATARVITSAALIMVVVFAGFVANPATFVKMIGLGLAVAVLLDATIIRMVLVPSTMALLGNANWWFPSWLDRLLPQVDVDSDDPGAHSSTIDEPDALVA